MYGEKPSFIPEELVEQAGPNKGNISDIELASVGAETQKQFMESNFKDNFLNTRANEEAETAMLGEVANRADAFARQENVSPSAVDCFSEKMSQDFALEHANKTEERIDDEIDSLVSKATDKDANSSSR
jgi:hypothetical protein